MSNMREISIEECNAVFGGNDAIVVSGRRTVPGSTNFAGTYGPVYNSSMLPAGIMGSYEDIYDPDTADTDGDDIPDAQDEIIVLGAIPASTQATLQTQAQTITNGLIIMGAIVAGPIVVNGTALSAALTPVLGEAAAIVVTGRALAVGSAAAGIITSDTIQSIIYGILVDAWLKDYQDDGVRNNSPVYQSEAYKQLVDEYNEAAKEWNNRMERDPGQGFGNPDD